MILKHLEQYLANGGEEFPKITTTTTSLTLSKSLSTVGLNFPTSEMMERMNWSQEDAHWLNSAIMLWILLQL